MRRFTVAAAAVAAVVMLVGCSGTISTGGAPKKTPIKTWPMAEPLTGAAPVGYWECVDTFDVEELRISNKAPAPRQHRCRNLDGQYAIEYRPDGTGYDLKQYRRGQ